MFIFSKKFSYVFIHSLFYSRHVHEKAILLVTIPMAVLAVMSPCEARYYVILNFVGNFSLFPLLHEDRESVVKCLLLVFNHIITIVCLNLRRKAHQKPLSLFDKIYLFSFIPIYFLCRYLHLINETFQFLPLMIYSLLCSVGVLTQFVNMYTYFWKTSSVEIKE